MSHIILLKILEFDDVIIIHLDHHACACQTSEGALSGLRRNSVEVEQRGLVEKLGRLSSLNLPHVWKTFQSNDFQGFLEKRYFQNFRFST